MEQKGGSIQWISERHFEQIPCGSSSKNFSQQGHWGGKKNWKRVDRKFMVHDSKALPALSGQTGSLNGK